MNRFEFLKNKLVYYKIFYQYNLFQYAEIVRYNKISNSFTFKDPYNNIKYVKEKDLRKMLGNNNDEEFLRYFTFIKR